jgi:hypothetical protein
MSQRGKIDDRTYTEHRRLVSSTSDQLNDLRRCVIAKKVLYSTSTVFVSHLTNHTVSAAVHRVHNFGHLIHKREVEYLQQLNNVFWSRAPSISFSACRQTRVIKLSVATIVLWIFSICTIVSDFGDVLLPQSMS